MAPPGATTLGWNLEDAAMPWASDRVMHVHGLSMSAATLKPDRGRLEHLLRVTTIVVVRLPAYPAWSAFGEGWGGR
jgi:hypothetical protein